MLSPNGDIKSPFEDVCQIKDWVLLIHDNKVRGQPMWIINKFYNSIIKSANVDKGGGGGGGGGGGVKRLSTKCG